MTYELLQQKGHTTFVVKEIEQSSEENKKRVEESQVHAEWSDSKNDYYLQAPWGPMDYAPVTVDGHRKP
mgnify:CR=1 FL=1